MKLATTILLCAAGAVACSHDSRPQSVSTAPPPAPPPAGAQLPYQTPPTLTPASGAGSPRPVSAPLVPTDPLRDKADSPQDQESIREIRELLASDPALKSTASQVTIVARDGRVWLRGQINTAEQRAAVEKAARKAGGVIDVRNELVVME